MGSTTLSVPSADLPSLALISLKDLHASSHCSPSSCLTMGVAFPDCLIISCEWQVVNRRKKYNCAAAHRNTLHLESATDT